MKLTTSQKEKILSLLRRLGARQKELATKMGYATGNLSGFLNASKDKGVEDATWLSLVNALEQMAAARPQICAKDPSIERDIADINTWAVNGADSDAPKSNGGQVHPPKGPLPADADNYVLRRADDIIKDIIKHPGPRSVLVQGGMGTGRTSWLLRMRQAALDSGATVVFFDAGFLTQAAGNGAVGTIIGRIADELKLAALKEIATDHGDGRTVAAEVLSAMKPAPATGPVYLIIDDVGNWPENLGKHDAMIEFVTQLHLALIGAWEFPYKLVLVSALTPSEWSAFIGSRLESQSTVAALGFYSLDETRTLAAHYRLDHVVVAVHGYTAGHPSLTHVMLWSCRDGKPVAEAIEEARTLDDADGWWGMSLRWKAVMTHMCAELSIPFRPLMRKYVDKFGAGKNDDTRLTQAEITLLKSMGVLDGPARNPTASPFFVDVAEAWLEDEES